MAEPRARRATALLALLATASLGLAGCAGVRDAFAPEPAVAAGAADDLLETLAARFGPTNGTAEHAAARDLLLRHSFSPSPLLNASLWRERTGPRRTVAFAGAPVSAAQYQFAPASVLPTLAAPGQSSTVLALTAQGEGGFAWERRDELATGRFGGEAATAGWVALLRGLERAAAAREDAALRLRRDLPRTSRALGRALTLHALDARQEGATTTVAMGLALVPGALRVNYPRYARFLATYVTPMRLALRVQDDAGRPLVTADGSDLRLTLRFRVQEGRLVSLARPYRAAGRRFSLSTGFSTRSGPFRVGLEDLHAQGEIAGGSQARVALTFREEPRWLLPFFVKPFLRSPLRYPFEGAGSRVEFAFAPGLADGNVVSRDYGFAVKETWITRFLGSMASATIQDFRSGAEAEADAFTREAILALRDDLRALR